MRLTTSQGHYERLSNATKQIWWQCRAEFKPATWAAAEFKKIVIGDPAWPLVPERIRATLLAENTALRNEVRTHYTFFAYRSLQGKAMLYEDLTDEEKKIVASGSTRVRACSFWYRTTSRQNGLGVTIQKIPTDHAFT